MITPKQQQLLKSVVQPHNILSRSFSLLQEQANKNHLNGLRRHAITTTTTPISSTKLQALPYNPLSAMVTMESSLLLRGGGGGARTTTRVVLDMAKESQHLAVLSSYTVLTVLILNSALRLYTTTKFKRKSANNNKIQKMSKYDWVLPNLFSFCAGTCVITGAFTGVMFQLLGIYSKSALSYGNYAGYATFKAATHWYRKLGFHTFLTCLASFVAVFLISMRNMTDEDERLGDRIFALMVVLTFLGGIVIKKILNLATAHIFAPMMM